MKTKFLKLALLSVVFALFPLTTSAGMLIPANENAQERAKAPEKSPVITETETGAWNLEKVDFIHYAKPPQPAKGPKAPTCYKLMGVKWKSLSVNYVINPTNPDNLSTEFVTSTLSTSAETWDNATASELFNDNYSVDGNAQYGIQDFKNAITFGNYSDPNVIAVTSIWYTRVGKQIVEFDMLLDTDFTWGDASVNSSLMDLQNIATHELGHGVGLNDIYSSFCSEATMYGYSNYGDIIKRTLEPPDITGLQSMYGL